MSRVKKVWFEARSVGADRIVTHIDCCETLDLNIFTTDIGDKSSFPVCEIIVSKTPRRTNDKEVRIYIPFDQVWKVIKKLQKERKAFQKRRPRYQVD